MLNAKTITTAQIGKLRSEAEAAQDTAQIIVCARAVGEEIDLADWCIDGHERSACVTAAGMTQDEVQKTARLVQEINRDKALIVVEHDMQFIKMIASKVTVFNQGAVLVEDSVENIMRDPRVRDVYLGKQAAA